MATFAASDAFSSSTFANGKAGDEVQHPKVGITEDLLFPNAFCSLQVNKWSTKAQGGRYPRTLLELETLQIMQAIAEKQDWQRKVHNDPTITRWANESRVFESVVKYAIDEMLSRDIDIQVIQGCRPKSLTDLCISVVRRSLPNIDGGCRLNGLPQEIVDRITTLNDSSGIKFMGLEGVYARDDIDDALRAKLYTGVEQLRAVGPLD